MSPLLDGRVVVVAGVGDGLGRSLALRSAAAGASVVLAARNAERLDAVAADVVAAGAKALAVPTDLRDAAAVEALAEAAVGAFGQVDAVLHNAFVMPPMCDLVDASHDAIHRALDVNVLSLVTAARAFTPALSASSGSVVAINSSVLRHSRPPYAAYKLTKAALLAAAQSLATELGPRGIRVNSVAPGWIWAETLKFWFDHLAGERGVEPQVVYDETAATTDLRRLPEPDAIADVAVFLASSMARDVTGQCLDVNCGEFHS